MFKLFIKNHDNRTECTLSKTADGTKLDTVVSMLQGMAAIQRDLDKLEKWTDGNLMKLNKSKCKLLHLGWDNPMQQYRPWQTVQQKLCRKRSEGLGEQPVDHELTMCSCGKAAHQCPGTRVMQDHQAG